MMPEKDHEIKVVPQANDKTCKADKEPKSKQSKRKLKTVDDLSHHEKTNKKYQQNAQENKPILNN